MYLFARVATLPLTKRIQVGFAAVILTVAWNFVALGEVLTPAMASKSTVQSEQDAINQGVAFENSELWADAVRHYETESRLHPESKTLYQRLLISRLHYDVNRRFQDQSYLKSIRELDSEASLDLYAEVLANLQTHYVDPVDWSRIQLHGTAALEIALTEKSFLNRVLPSADPASVEAFRLGIHRKMVGRSTATRFDLRANVAFVAGLAHDEIGLSHTATVLEFLSGAVSTLDPYTRLLSGNQLDEMFSNIEGNFVGLGIELKSLENRLQILSVIPGGPADEAGIVAGDSIVRVDDARTSAVDPDLVADMLRGLEGSYASVTVADAKGVNRELNVQRRRVDVPCVENVHFINREAGIGYFRLTNFQKTTTRDIERELWNLHRDGMRSLVIDVRGNPGGLLSAAVEVADRFMSSGRIVTTRGRNARENFDYAAHRPNTWDIPLVVLVDRDSASASEIFAGAIADSGRGTIIGETSYGKGSVQGIFRMQSAKFGLCLTTAKFYSPSGRPISFNGVTPHIAVEPTSIASRPNAEGRLTLDTEDAALQKALEHLDSRNLISRRP